MMNFQTPIYTEKTQCQDCYKCIRECPVKAIRVEGGHATVVPELCILCGHCVMICPASAKKVRDDLSRAKQLLRLKERVVISLAPSFASEFPGVEPAILVAAIKALGFYGASETAVGADLVSAQLAEDFSKNTEQKLYISSACPATVEFIKMYMSEFSPYITDRASPLLAHTRLLRKIYGQDTGVVFVGPCIAKKRESDVWASPDCSIGFGDLKRWFNSAGIDLYNKTILQDGVIVSLVDEPFIPYRAAKGALYPVDGGMIAAIKKYAPLKTIDTIAVTGIEEIARSLKGLNPQSLKTPLFMELLACPGGCINGPLTTKGDPTALKRIRLLDYAKDAQDVLKEERPAMEGTLPGEKVNVPYYTEEDIRVALRQVGKYDISDELNCGSCGYDTCRSFCMAMLENRAEKTMCVSYMRILAQKKANGLIKTIPSGVVICDSQMKIIECNENFARLMGADTLSMYEAKPGMEGADLEKISSMHRYFRDVLAPTGPDVVEHELREEKQVFHITVFSIEKGEIACGVIQDVTAPQIRRERVINQTKKVIDKNLAVVQKIAFLLGENAAETEATLNSIIESFSIDEVES